MAEQMQPMPDVPERCPFCNSGDRREETWHDKPAYSFSCGTVFYANGEVAFRYFFCYALEEEREKQAIREQLAAARAEAERLQAALVAACEAVEAARRGLVETLKRYDERMMAARGEGTD